MTSLNRSLTGPVLSFSLEEQLQEMEHDEAYQRSGRAGRTLAKAGPFRTTLVALRAGVDTSIHQADSPLSVQVLRGEARYRCDGREHELRQGELLFFGAGEAHDVTAISDCALLLTLAATGDDDRSGEA